MDEMMSVMRTLISEEIQKANNHLAIKPDKNDDFNKILSKEEVCNILKVCPTTLYLWDKKGIFVPKKIGRRVYYLNSDVIAKLEDYRAVS